MTADTPMMATQVDSDPVELQIGADLVKRGLIVAPLLVVACWLIWGVDGAWSAAFAIGLVLVNFVVSAALIVRSAQISLGMLMGATLFGYLLRLGLVTLAVYLVKDASWISRPALGATIIVTHLGLLVWELRYVTISLSHSGPERLRP